MPLIVCESQPKSAFGFGFWLAGTLQIDNVYSFSVPQLKKEQHRQRSKKHTDKCQVCVPLERFLSGAC
jgi:hypothetical protein